MNIFDLVFDNTQFTNCGLFGTKHLAYQDNYMMQAFLSQMEEVYQAES